MKKLILFTITMLSFGFAHAERSLMETIMQDRNSSPAKLDTTNEARRARQASAAEYMRDHNRPTERIYIEERITEPEYREPGYRAPADSQ
ncbi:hypothetical protein ACLSU7_01575 [Bdellovibrio sp. HCB185ZH]|uniref:hypothetical protein n=1 Tax=Bdellovibrio sp. HCB185ZH TaxID=3394235 RepID=UPI0039A6923F